MNLSMEHYLQDELKFTIEKNYIDVKTIIDDDDKVNLMKLVNLYYE